MFIWPQHARTLLSETPIKLAGYSPSINMAQLGEVVGKSVAVRVRFGPMEPVSFTTEKPRSDGVKKMTGATFSLFRLGQV